MIWASLQSIGSHVNRDIANDRISRMIFVCFADKRKEGDRSLDEAEKVGFEGVANDLHVNRRRILRFTHLADAYTRR